MCGLPTCLAYVRGRAETQLSHDNTTTSIMIPLIHPGELLRKEFMRPRHLTPEMIAKAIPRHPDFPDLDIAEEIRRFIAGDPDAILGLSLSLALDCFFELSPGFFWRTQADFLVRDGLTSNATWLAQVKPDRRSHISPTVGKSRKSLHTSKVREVSDWDKLAAIETQNSGLAAYGGIFIPPLLSSSVSRKNDKSVRKCKTEAELFAELKALVDSLRTSKSRGTQRTGPSSAKCGPSAKTPIQNKMKSTITG